MIQSGCRRLGKPAQPGPTPPSAVSLVHAGHFVAQDYLGAVKHYYEPTEQGVEKKLKERVAQWRAALDRVRADVGTKVGG